MGILVRRVGTYVLIIDLYFTFMRCSRTRSFVEGGLCGHAEDELTVGPV